MKRLALACGLALVVAATSLHAVDPLRTQANVYFNLGYKKFQENDPDGALKSLNKALAAVPLHQQSNFLKGVILIQKGKYEEAVRPLEIVTHGQEANADAWNNLGVAYYSLDRWADAERAFRKTAELSPDRADVFQNLGVIAINKEGPEALKDAVAAFEQAVKLDPTKAEAHRGLGQAYFRMGNPEKATASFEKALSHIKDPQSQDSVALRLLLADIYFNEEKLDKLREVLEPLKDSSNPEARFFFGVMAYREGQFDESRRWFRRALESRPNYPEASFNLAITLYDQGDYEEALKQFENVLRRNPKDRQARENMDITKRVAVQSFLKQGSELFIREEYYDALQLWDRALQLDPDNRVALDLVETAKIQAKAQIGDLIEKGGKAMDEGNWSVAFKRYSSVLEIDPKNKEAQKGLDKVRGKAAQLIKDIEAQVNEAIKDKDWTKADTLATQAIKVDKRKAKVLSQKVGDAKSDEAIRLAKVARIAAEQGELAEAARVYDMVTKLAPEDSRLRLSANKAKVALRLALEKALEEAEKAEKSEDYAKAYAGYRKALDLQPENSAAIEGARSASKRAKIKVADPKKVNDLYYQGVYAFAAGDNDKAIGLWKQVLTMDKGHQLAKAAVQRAEEKVKALQAVE